MCATEAMGIDELRDLLAAFPGTRVLESGGDFFAVYDPGGDIPPVQQRPWATIITTNAYDDGSDLDREGVYRLNLGLPKELAADVVNPDAALTSLDVLMPHPHYARLGFVCVLNPATTWPQVRDLLDAAHRHAAHRHASRRT